MSDWKKSIFLNDKYSETHDLDHPKCQQKVVLVRSGLLPGVDFHYKNALWS